ncbi:hypothetical protein ACQP3F_30120, partial [Escherichia coli]
LTISLPSIYEYHQATTVPLFLASLQTLTAELTTVSKLCPELSLFSQLFLNIGTLFCLPLGLAHFIGL